MAMAAGTAGDRAGEGDASAAGRGRAVLAAALLLSLAALAALVPRPPSGGSRALPVGGVPGEYWNGSAAPPLARSRLEPYPDLATALDPVCSDPPAPERACPEGMAFVAACGGFCIDRYEASRGSGGLPESAPAQEPWAGASWSEARDACAAAGKRLCKDFEWMAACDLEGRRYFLVDEEAGEAGGCRTVRDACGGRSCRTGSAPRCRSAAGVFDMVGNVEEWTDAAVPDGSWAGGWADVGDVLGRQGGRYGDDYLYRDAEGVAGLHFLRGGAWNATLATSMRRGCFSLGLFSESGYAATAAGFRCCAGGDGTR